MPTPPSTGEDTMTTTTATCPACDGPAELLPDGSMRCLDPDLADITMTPADAASIRTAREIAAAITSRQSYMSLGVRIASIEATTAPGELPIVLRGITADHYPAVGIHISARDATRLVSQLLDALVAVRARDRQPHDGDLPPITQPTPPTEETA